MKKRFSQVRFGTLLLNIAKANPVLEPLEVIQAGLLAKRLWSRLNKGLNEKQIARAIKGLDKASGMSWDVDGERVFTAQFEV